MIPEKLFVPSKTDTEKLQSLDSCIKSCLKMIQQDILKRSDLKPNKDLYHGKILGHIHKAMIDFKTLKG